MEWITEAGTVFFTANKDDPQQEKLFSVKLDGSGMQNLSAENGNYEATFADNATHFVETHSTAMMPPRISRCAPSADRARRFGRARSIAAYDPIVPKPLEFKADDGTVLYGYLILPRHADAEPEDPAHRSYLWRPGGSDGTGRMGRIDCAVSPDSGANQGYAIFSVDNRGTPDRGKEYIRPRACSREGLNSKISSLPSTSCIRSFRSSIRLAPRSGDGRTAGR